MRTSSMTVLADVWQLSDSSLMRFGSKATFHLARLLFFVVFGTLSLFHSARYSEAGQVLCKVSCSLCISRADLLISCPQLASTLFDLLGIAAG